VEKALALGFGGGRLKLNVVVMRGMNEDEVADFAALTFRFPITVRFIEFMPLGRSGLTDDPQAAMVTEAEIRGRIEEGHGRSGHKLMPVRRNTEAGVGPAKVWSLSGAVGRLGFISAMSHPFCDTCNRLRLTPDGLLRSCLFDGGEVDLKPILRNQRQESGLPKTEGLDPSGNLESVESRLLAAFASCVTMKPLTHSFHGNKAMNRIGG
jgi:cyclic pyranopterin phosphate synthase